MLTEAQRLGLRLVNVHKGLPAIFAPGSEETVRATDFPKVVRDLPQLSFCAYHSAYFGRTTIIPRARTGSNGVPRGDRRACRRRSASASTPRSGRRSPSCSREGPDAAAHFIGQLLKALGPSNILWGTDSIWWGSPQWLIDAFKVLHDPRAMQEQFGYPPLTEKAKRRILGLNAARLYKVKPKRQPRGSIRATSSPRSQDEQGGAHAGRRLVAHGPRTRREFFAMLRPSGASSRWSEAHGPSSSVRVPRCRARRAPGGIRVAAEVAQGEQPVRAAESRRESTTVTTSTRSAWAKCLSTPDGCGRYDT